MQTTLFDLGKPTDAPGQTLLWEDEHQQPREAPPIESIAPYSVLLLRPDYVADEYGKDVYFAHVCAANPAKAVSIAQAEAAVADETDLQSAIDYHALIVLPGHVETL